MSQRTSPQEPTSADASRQGSQASEAEDQSLTGRCSASEQNLHGGPYPLRQTSTVEFYDMAADDEPGDRAASVASETWDEQKVQHISAGLDFLGFVENKKLVPAVSSFRRMLKKSARTAARHKEKEQQDQTKGQRNHEALMSGLEVAQSHRHQRRQSVRERSRERQRGSMETVAERLGEAVRSRRSMATLESPLAVVPEEDDVKCEACDTCNACEAADPEVETFPKVEPPSPASSTETPRKRFSLPLPRRKTSSCGSLTGTDSEDSMSSAGVSDTSRPSCSGRRSTGSSKALDAIFERARAGKSSNNVTPHAEGSLSTTASSQGSSPRFVTPLERGTLESPKPTVAGAAWVLMQLFKQETPSQEVDQKPAPSETQVVSSTRSLKSSMISTEAFKFCFPQDICGVPLEPKSATKEADRWRRGRRKTAA